MSGLEIRNELALVQVSRDSQLTIRVMPEGAFCGAHDLSEGYVAVQGGTPLTGLLYYTLPCTYESLIVRKEGVTGQIINRCLGQWPESLDEDELGTYPYLHLLQERRTGIPWRLEQWYTLAGPSLIFDSEHYFERERPPVRGQNWERLIVQLRQVIDLPALVSGPCANKHILTAGEPAR